MRNASVLYALLGWFFLLGRVLLGRVPSFVPVTFGILGIIFAIGSLAYGKEKAP